MNHSTIAHIDLDAAQHNLRVIKRHAPNSKIIAMVKSNAYGHGAIKIAQSLAPHVAAFGVAFLTEALQLKQAGIDKPILVLTGFLDQKELIILNEQGFACAISSFAQITILERTKLTKTLHVWLELDTGLHRLGFQAQQLPEAYQRLTRLTVVHKPLRLITHFSDSNDLDSNKTQEQIDCLQNVASELNVDIEQCMANSAAILYWPMAQANWIRPGAALYGIAPIEHKTGLDLDLKPVMTLISRIIATHDLKQGEKIGYGGIYTCPEDMRIGVVAIGYGHGYPRNTKTGAPVLINGIRTQLIGRVAMDMICVDLRPVPKANIGDNVVLWGRGLPAEEVAAFADESVYELLSRLTSRVHYQTI